MYDSSGLESRDTLDRYTERHNGRLPTNAIPKPSEDEKAVEEIIADHNEAIKNKKGGKDDV